jgi:hypothetical protein
MLEDKEDRFFGDMRAQQTLESEMRFLGRDKSQLTIAELRDAKQKKEKMLRSSMAAITADDLADTLETELDLEV